MGGRGVGIGGGKRFGQFIGFGTYDPATGEVIMQKGMHRVTPAYTNVIKPSDMISHTEAAKIMADGLAKSGIKGLSRAESANLAGTLLLSGSLLGTGSLRTKLYRTGRFLGDFTAIQGGTKTMLRRIQRRLIGKITGKTFRKLFK